MEETKTQTNVIQDKKIPCKACQKDFVWSASEQKYYEKKGFTKQPQKCSACRDKANKLRGENMFYIHCGICEKDAVMITPPPKDRVAICSDCYEKFVKESETNSPESENTNQITQA